MKMDSGRHSPRLSLNGRGRVFAFYLLILLLVAGVLFTAGCDIKVPIKEDIIEDLEIEYQEELRASPREFQVVNISSVVTWDDDFPTLTLLVVAGNPNSYPRSFRSVRVEIFDDQGRQQGFKTWTTQRSPYIIEGNGTLPIAMSFPGKSEWHTAKAYFSSQITPNPNDVHQGLDVVSTEPIKQGDSLGASITVQNLGASSAVDVTVLAAGYNADGDLVAWSEGLQQWRTVTAGSVATFETDAFLGDIMQVTTVRAYVSAYRG